MLTRIKFLRRKSTINQIVKQSVYQRREVNLLLIMSHDARFDIRLQLFYC